jgi:thioredoxin-like negative regulator of GroEL
MLSITIAAAASLLAFSTMSPTPPRVVASGTVANVVSAIDHLANARKALSEGAFDDARREFSAAAALDREAGRLPVESATGLAYTLFAQQYDREAAYVLSRLAADAADAGNAEVEAKALLDVVWLNVQNGQRAEARVNGLRLRELRDKHSVTPETGLAITRRIG